MMMKRILYSFFALILLAAACNKDGEMLKVTEPGTPSDFTASPTEVVLSNDATDALVLTLVWKAGALPQVSDPTVALPDNLTEESVQFSSTEDFASVSEVFLEKGQTSLQFTGGELSKLLIKLGMTDVKQHNLYARIAVKMGSSYTYSNVLVIKVTPYAVETGWMQIVDKNDMTSVLATLHCKTDSPSVYEGFAVTPSGWYNCFFVAADGTVWGCNSDWTAFSLVGGSGNNCWFAEPSGCQYVYADTANGMWWHVYVPSVNITVDGAETVLKYSKSAGGYSGTITTAADNTVVTVAGVGARYDMTTGTDAGIPGISYPFSLEPVGEDSFGFVNAESPSAGFNIAKAGTCTITFNVTDCKWSVSEGGSEGPVVTYPESVAMYYYVKEGSDMLSLACEMSETADEGIFEGFIYTDPNWGANYSNWRFHADDKVYSSNGDGQFVLGEGGWNCWSSNTGMNYVVADFTTMTWSETKVTTVAVAGDFNGWSLDADRMTFNLETGKWEAICDIANVGWGFKFVLDDGSDSWRWMYADTDLDGTLSIAGSNDNIVPAEGKYRLELNLSSFTAPTYTMTPIE
ncbi:MAG: DUF5111 domain-containing protein [Candidatus Cryptobacteroides sp.]